MVLIASILFIHTNNTYFCVKHNISIISFWQFPFPIQSFIFLTQNNIELCKLRIAHIQMNRMSHSPYESLFWNGHLCSSRTCVRNHILFYFLDFQHKTIINQNTMWHFNIFSLAHFAHSPEWKRVFAFASKIRAGTGLLERIACDFWFIFQR